MSHHPDPKLKDLQPRLQEKAVFTGTPAELAAYTKCVTDEKYKNAQTFREQIGIMCYYLRNEDIRVSYGRIANIFQVKKSKIKKQETKYINGANPDGRPRALAKIEQDYMIEEIQKLHDKQIYPTYPQIADILYFKFNKIFKADTLRNYIQDHCPMFSTCQGVPMEDLRIEAQENDIDSYYENLTEALLGIPPEFVYNVDEVGQDDYADAREIRVIVPSGYEKQTAPYPVTRKGKRATAVVCISQSGEWINPLFVVQRSTIDSEFRMFIPHRMFLLSHTETGYVNTATFKYWLDNSFIPYVRKKRNETGYNGKAILLLDGFTAHKNAIDEEYFLNENIQIMYLPPHTSDQTQPLDLATSNVFKTQCI